MTYVSGPDFVPFILVAVMLLVVVVTQLASSERVARNGFVGIRIPPTMASDAAWAAGHKAALIPSWIGFGLIVVVAVVAQFMHLADWILIVVLLLFLAWTVVAAWRGARSATD